MLIKTATNFHNELENLQGGIGVKAIKVFVMDPNLRVHVRTPFVYLAEEERRSIWELSLGGLIDSRDGGSAHEPRYGRERCKNSEN